MNWEITIPIIPLACVIIGITIGLIYKYFNPTVVYERRKKETKTEADYLHLIRAVKKIKPLIYNHLHLDPKKEKDKAKIDSIDGILDASEELLQDAEIIKLIRDFTR